MRLNLAKAFNLGADDPEGWKKALLFLALVAGSLLLSWLILPGLFLLLYLPGYSMEYTRNVAAGDNQRKLPEVFSVTGLWRGFMAMLIYIIYCLPLMGVAFLGFGAAIAGLATGSRINSGMAAMGGLAGAGLMGVVACLLGLVVAIVLPMVVLQYCKAYQFSDAFNFGAIFGGMMQSPLDYAAVVIIPMIVLTVVGMIPGVNFLAWPIVGLIGSNLIGQYGATALGMGPGREDVGEVGFSKF